MNNFKMNFNFIKKYKIFLIAILISFFAVFAFPEQTSAFIGTGVFDYFDAAGGGVEETASPIIGNMIKIFILYGVGWVGMTVTSFGVDYLLTNPELLSLSGDSLVEAGWNFSSGLANLFIIILFVIVALAFILKWEKFSPKKALFRLIIVALLVNFSFLFCQIFVDASNILMESFVNVGFEDGKIAQTLVSQATAVCGNQIAALIAYFVGLTVAALTVALGPATQAGAVFVLAVTFLPNVLSYFVQLGISYLLFSIFFLYFVILVLRVVIVKILTIVAPLAFLCFVLPQTEGLGKKWFDNMVQWSFYVVPLTFFLMLASFILKTPVSMELSKGFDSMGFLFTNLDSLGEFFATNFFLVIFLVVALIISKKMIPDNATQLISGIVQNSKPFVSPIVKFGKSIGKTATLGAREGITAADRGYNELKDEREESLELGYDSLPATKKEKFLGGISKGSAWVKRASKNPYALEMEKYSKKEKLGENLTADDLKFAFGGITTYNDSAKVELINRSTAKEINKFLNTANLEKQKEVLSIVGKFGDKDTKEKVMRSSLMGDGKDEERIRSVNAVYGKDKIIRETSGKAALDINVKAFKDGDNLASMLSSWKPNDFKNYANENREIIDEINKKLDVVKKITEANNPALYNNITSPNSMFKEVKTNSTPQSQQSKKPWQNSSYNQNDYKPTNEE